MPDDLTLRQLTVGKPESAEIITPKQCESQVIELLTIRLLKNHTMDQTMTLFTHGNRVTTREASKINDGNNSNSDFTMYMYITNIIFTLRTRGIKFSQ
ncbi:MAG: hypothetical protein Q4D71_12440 [Oscillospiraceae bacterium]|nr:hypothetical protein [Oscillospiraceae bacterium]